MNISGIMDSKTIINCGKKLMGHFATASACPGKFGAELLVPLEKDIVEISSCCVQKPISNLVENIDVSKTAEMHGAIERAAKRVTADEKLQEALVRITEKEGIVVRTKEDALPILQRQYESLSDVVKKNLYVLNINPQSNNGMPKSNTLISQWYAEANGIDPSRVVTLLPQEMAKRILLPQDICSQWGQGSKTASIIMRRVDKINLSDNPMSLDKARNLIAEVKGHSEQEILTKFSTEEIAQALQKINTLLIQPFKKEGYTSSLASQIQSILSKSNEKVYFVIPDDCSLSGSSIICDTARIIERAFSDNSQLSKKAGFVFSPMICGEKAEKVINDFISKNGISDEKFLTDINAIAANGAENFKGARTTFEKIKNMPEIDFHVSDGAKKAVHFAQTETFRKIGEQDPILQQQLLYIMQGPLSGNGHLYGGFGDCGVMVITPTQKFSLDGNTYAGKVPTNSVGFMEAVGLEAGVLNDALPKDIKGKGLFMKGTGKGYQRYIEWDGLANPTTIENRIPIYINDSRILRVS